VSDLLHRKVDQDGDPGVNKHVCKMPAPRLGSKQRIVDRKESAEQRTIVRVYGEDHLVAGKRPHARKKSERYVAQLSYERAVYDLLKVVGGKLVPDAVCRSENRQSDRRQDRKPPDSALRLLLRLCRFRRGL